MRMKIERMIEIDKSSSLLEFNNLINEEDYRKLMIDNNDKTLKELIRIRMNEIILIDFDNKEVLIERIYKMILRENSDILDIHLDDIDNIIERLKIIIDDEIRMRLF